MSVPLAEKILGVLNEGLGAWKTYLATRQEAYNRHQDKKQVNAIESAEKFIFNADQLVNELGDDDKIKHRKILANMIHFRKRFFHYH